MKRHILALALGTGILAMAALAAMASADQQASPWSVSVLSDRCILSFTPTGIRDQQSENAPLQRLVALPPDASRASARLLAGPEGAEVSVTPIAGRLRGLPVALLTLAGTGGAAAEVELGHDGDWLATDRSAPRRYARGFDAALGGALAGLPREADQSENGTYVILTVDDFVPAVAELADWRRRQGFHVEIVTTTTTGTTNTAIQSWLRDAYATWERPPEYLCIVGDILQIPTWYIAADPTDHYYARMDEDWLPDLLVGRLPVESATQVENLAAKIVAYERDPYLGDTGWYTRSLMIAGNYGSETPTYTTTWCGEQLETIGFDPATEVYFPPFFDGVAPITAALDNGVGYVAYRGWAYGDWGWEPPHFINDDVPGVANGAMMPVVMSFVCHTANFANPAGICLGEAFLRHGTAADPQGAVAYIGNAEHWSYTRYNDAMAIAVFERIVDRGIVDLGGLMVSAKMRFWEHFPHQPDFAETGEESVEFYFHIYILLGDPATRHWLAAPTAITVAHPATLPAGGNFVEVTVTEADGMTPLAGARVGVAQDDEVLGCAFTDAAGLAHVELASVAAGADVAVTVTAPDRQPYEGVATVDDGAAHLAVTGFALDDGAGGNGDGLASPNESVALLATLGNATSQGASGVSATLLDAAGATVTQASAAFADIPAGDSTAAATAFQVQLDADLEDGARLRFPVDATHDAGTDRSDLILGVAAPRLTPGAVTLGGDGFADPGETVSLVVALTNDGSVDAGAAAAVLAIADGGLGSVTDADGAFAAIAVDSTGDNAADPFEIQVAAGLPAGTALPFTLSLTIAPGIVQETSFSVLVGEVNAGAPAGPDAYGYWVYDSADLFYDQRPDYAWTEISPTFGGDGTKVDYPGDNIPMAPVALPFTFRYFGEDVASIRVCDNGWIAFDTDDFWDYFNWPMPHEHGNHSIIAPFWDNLDPMRILPGEPGYLAGDELKDGVYTWHDVAGGRFIVEWSRVRHFIKTEIHHLQTFQVVLLDPATHATPTGDGEIHFYYRQVTNADHLRNYATVGFEDATETRGLQLSYCGINADGMAPVGPGLAVRVTTEAPTYAPFVVDAFRCEPDPEAGLRLSWTTRDERPVLGWRLVRVDGSREEALGDVLAPGARSFRDVAADPDRDASYRLVALHPWDQESRLGPFDYVAGQDTQLRLALGQSRPNPMTASTRIDYVLPAPGRLSLKIYDAAGRLVRTLSDGPAAAGPGAADWDGRDDAGRPAATGVYVYRLESGDKALTRKLMLVR